MPVSVDLNASAKGSTKMDTIEERCHPSPSNVFLKESPKKSNLSFTFNFDFDDVNSENSSDSDTADLQIDVSEVDNYEPSCKHRREAIEETCSMLNEMEEEIERQLDAKAAKTNLTATNVKNILKHVITNEHVMAMVQKRLHETEDDVIFEPKLTRAKAKELAAAQVNIPWPITPIKKASSEVQVLIEEELSEDSSDEEYNPEQDKQSDDDRETENSTNSDVDSQIMTTLSHYDLSLIEQPKSVDIRYDPEGIFKIPNVPHVPTEEESIGQRTRSKLCLSETSLEQIEQAFIPPDITTDMYDWDCDVDEDWDNFLKEFNQPLTQEPVTEDDPEADPEYNILEDEETDFLDKEELRADKAVKVTRKELNNLIAELFEFTDTFSKQEQEISKKKKSSESLNSSIENNSLNCSMGNMMSVTTDSEIPNLINTEQRYLLAIQLRQHIQLMTQHFAMTYMHPELHSQSKTCKQNLNSLRYLSSSPNSAFNAENLPDALKLVSDWENKFLDDKFLEDFKKSMADDEALKKIFLANKCKHIPKFNSELLKLFVESKALMYPQLLPEMPFRSELNAHVRTPYLKSEENLLALGLEQFIPFVASKPRKFKSKRLQLVDAVQLITEYLLPCRESQGVICYIQKRRCAKDPNPIKHYFEKGCAPRTIHCITLECDLKAPKDQPINQLPPVWQIYLTSKDQKVDILKRIQLLSSYNNSMKKDYCMSKNSRIYSTTSITHPLRNPIVNILPKILPTNMNQKSTTNNTMRNGVHVHENVGSSIGPSCKVRNIEHVKNVSNNTTNIVSNSSELINKTRGSFCNGLLKTNAPTTENKEKEIDTNALREEVKCSNRLNSVTVKEPKISKKSNEILHGSPQLRQTTPRLAKTRSAQNMKLMAQVLGSKSLASNCNSVKSREKPNLDKNVEKGALATKVDNEDEIAELMLASTTIKKDSVSRKKAKEARELENIKRLLESENSLNEEERESKFAASYLQKLHLTLESTNPEIFRSVIKLYLDYNEKLDNINQIGSKSAFSNTSKPSCDDKTIEEMARHKDTIAIDLYRDVSKKLEQYPELCTDFLLFLKPHQAAMIDKSVEYTMLQKMSDFVNVSQIYFAKQPSRIAKMMQAITQLSSDPQTTLESIQTSLSPILKGHPLVMDLFLQTIPTAKPPESLFAPHMFENLTCPVGPYDKNKWYNEDAPELYENIELPVLPSQEDPYGGENCKCTCHSGDDNNVKNVSEHCVSCGTRFLNGRIYLQTSEGLRPAKITFPGADEEKLENIARVSLKATDKFVLPPSCKQRRKSSKNESSHDELCQKHCQSKNSPNKNNEESEKPVIRSRKGTKSPQKCSDQKKPFKRLGNMDHIDISNKKIRVSQSKNRREKKIDKQEGKTGIDDSCAIDFSKSNEVTEMDFQCALNQSAEEKTLNTKLHVENISNTKDCTESITRICKDGARIAAEDIKIHNLNATKVHTPIEMGTADTNMNHSKPWTRQEDTILLQTIKKEYSETSLMTVSKILGDRTINEVKQRCQTLLSLLEKMM